MGRRHFLKSASALSVLSAADLAPWRSLGAVVREVEDFVHGPAVKDHPLRQLSPHVWMTFSPDGFPTPENQGMMCNISFVNTAMGLVVVDSGASVQIGEMAIRQIRRAFDKLVIAIINTHYHGDHWLGNHAYLEAYGDALSLYAGNDQGGARRTGQYVAYADGALDEPGHPRHAGSAAKATPGRPGRT